MHTASPYTLGPAPLQLIIIILHLHIRLSIQLPYLSACRPHVVVVLIIVIIINQVIRHTMTAITTWLAGAGSRYGWADLVRNG